MDARTTGRSLISGLAVLAKSVLVSAMLAPAAPAQTFTTMADAGPIVSDAFLSTGASWNDFDGDGWLDLLALGETSNHLYVNQGDGTFTARSAGTFLPPHGVGNAALWTDYDKDGDQDLFISNFATVPGGSIAAPNVLYASSGSPAFELTEVMLDGGVNASPSASWVDYDQDGDLDLFAAGAGRANGSIATPDLFHRQDAPGLFVNLTGRSFQADRRGIGTHDTWVDYDGDGDQDLYVVNWQFRNELYRSQLLETGNPDLFTLESSAGLSSDGFFLDIGSSWADYDNDGDLDVFIPFLNTADRLYENRGDGTFERITTTAIGSRRSVAGIWADYDNDGDVDLYAGSSSPVLYVNDGAGGFVEAGAEVGDVRQSPPALQAANWADYDNDGDLDLYLLTYAIPQNRNGTPQPNRLLRNDGGTNHWLMLRLQGVVSNGDAIGARVEVLSTIEGASVWQVRYVSGGTSAFVFQGDRRVHFGLGDAASADSVRIRWPSGIVQMLADVAADQIMAVSEEVPADFLRASFHAEGGVAEGGMVQFRNTTQSSISYPPTLFEWDLDGDGTVDSTDPDPIWTYSAAADTTISVSLRATSDVATSELVRQDYVAVPGTATASEPEQPRVAGLKLAVPAPNPCTDRCQVSFKTYRAGHIELSVIDVLGRGVRKLAAGVRGAGHHTVVWDARGDGGARLPAGVYFLVLRESGGGSSVESVILK